MARFTVPGVLISLLGVVWVLQGAAGKSSSGGMNGQPIWAVIGVVAIVCGIALVVIGRRKQARR
jgi:hypothetical protein